MINRKNIPNNIAIEYSLPESIYSYGYNLRLKHSSFKEDTLHWITHNFSELVTVEQPEILSLGCGTGVFDNTLIDFLNQKRKKWFFTGLDFCATDLRVFQKKLATFDKETQAKVNLEFNKFDTTSNLGKHYDLITMIHFLHSFDDVLPIIQNALRHISPGGKLLIVQQNKQGISELKEQFSCLLPNQKFQCSENIKKQLKTENIVFSSHEIKTSFDISIMRHRSLETLLLMSFCFVNDLSLLNTQQQEKIRQAFISFASKQNNEKDIIHESMEVIVCHV